MSHIIRIKGEKSGAYTLVREHFFFLQILYEMTIIRVFTEWAIAPTPPHPYSCERDQSADYMPKN